MFRLVRWMLSLAMFGALVWFATTVPLGKRTLWRHLVAIFSTQEAKDLADGTRAKAHEVAARLHPTETRPPLDPVGDRDRRQLDKLVQDKTTTAHHP